MENNLSNANGDKDHLNRGIGLENLRKRLDLTYPDRYTLITKPGKDAFHTNLTLILTR